MRRASWAASALMAAGLLLCGCHWLQSRKPAPETPQLFAAADVGKQAPDIDGVDLSGQRLHLADYKGQVVVLQFWANW